MMRDPDIFIGEVWERILNDILIAVDEGKEGTFTSIWMESGTREKEVLCADV